MNLHRQLPTPIPNFRVKASAIAAAVFCMFQQTIHADLSISRSSDGVVHLCYEIRPGWIHQVQKNVDLTSSWSLLEAEATGDWESGMVTVETDTNQRYFRLRRDIELAEVFPESDVSAEVAAYTQETWTDTAIAMCKKRYPDAAWFIEQDRQSNQWFRLFAPASSDLQQTAVHMASAIHETVHGAALSGGEGNDQRLVLGEGRFLDVPGDFSPMPRSAILRHLPQVSLDTQYDEIFLDEQFGGRQGFTSVLEELNGFTTGHQVEFAFRDTIPVGEINQRQGLLTFKLYTQIYLRTARFEQPVKYREILGSPRTVNATLVMWERAREAVEQSFGSLEPTDLDQSLRDLVFAPENIAEIERLTASAIRCQ